MNSLMTIPELNRKNSYYSLPSAVVQHLDYTMIWVIRKFIFEPCSFLNNSQVKIAFLRNTAVNFN